MGGGAAAVLMIGWLMFGRPDKEKSVDSTVARVDTAATAVIPAPAPAPAETAAVVKPLPEPEEKELPQPPAAETKKQAVRPTPPPPRTRQQPREQERRVAATAPAPQPAAPRPTPAPAPPPPPPPAPPPAAAQVVVVPPAASRPVEPPPAPRPSARDEITSIVAAYARAIESRDIGAVRRAYPGISGDQARGFSQFFESARSINVTFRVTGLETSGNTAEARLVGTYEYVSSDGKTQRQPVAFSASFRSDGSGWELRSVR